MEATKKVRKSHGDRKGLVLMRGEGVKPGGEKLKTAFTTDDELCTRP